MGPTKTAKLGGTDLVSNQKVNAGPIFDEPKHDQEATETGGEGRMRRRLRGQNGTDLSANANLAGRTGMSGAVKNATKKQTAAPNKHAPKPINLEQTQVKEG